MRIRPQLSRILETRRHNTTLRKTSAGTGASYKNILYSTIILRHYTFPRIGKNTQNIEAVAQTSRFFF